ncbi:MAG: cytochrome c class [Bacteroidetes bacterium]|nr:cytochrome c class [Bacteroidota bacterium]
MEKNNHKIDGRFILLLLSICIATLFFVRAVIAFFPDDTKAPPGINKLLLQDTLIWYAPDIKALDGSADSRQIKYGRELIINTSAYLGPKGSVMQISNGMNCQNCHLEAGTKLWGNNYSAVASTYPKFRERSGSVESIYKRVNDCLERSLNGSALDTGSSEMQAIRAYILWLGQDIPKGKKVKGVGITDVAYINRAADPTAGKVIYTQKCQSCHKENGEGVLNADGKSYQYPPLWGAHSYNNGAGLFRLSRIAGYVKSNMPFGTSYDAPQLTDEEAWDVAAYINSQPRPTKDLSKDWPKISGKPVDHPFGPYTDTFSEAQHKYGPFGPIAEYKKKQAKGK